jgi:hypothetical protein
MNEESKVFHSQANFHLTGIIPIAGQSLDFEMPYPDCMLPVASNYTLLLYTVGGSSCGVCFRRVRYHLDCL